MTKKNWISVKRGLSEDPKHRQAMGEAIWLFLHIIDAADWETGMVYDWKDKSIACDMSLSSATVRGWRDRLSDKGYITCVQKQHGLEIIIHNWIDPRNYSGKKLNVRQGDMDDSPLNSEEMPESGQGESQVDTQAPDPSRATPAPFIESTPSSTPTSEEEKKKMIGILETAVSSFCEKTDFLTWRKLKTDLEKPEVSLSRSDHTLTVAGMGMKAAFYDQRYGKSISRALAGIFNHPDSTVIFYE